MSATSLESLMARVFNEAANQRHEQQIYAWMLIGEIGDVLLTNQQSTGWIDVAMMMKTADQTEIQWRKWFL